MRTSAGTEIIAELERANYLATLSTAQATPGLDVFISDDVIISTSELFPTPDANHACLLQATADTADDLIAHIIQHYRSRGLNSVVALSPACTPDDLPQRLCRAGFTEGDVLEAWMALEDVQARETPDPFSGIEVRAISPDEAEDFAVVFAQTFGMPAEYAPAMAHLLAPSVGLPGVFHYLAVHGDKPVGTISLLHHGVYGILGSAGVLPEHRRSGAITNLMIHAVRKAQQLGIETLIEQTEAGRPLERLLRITGFQTIFTRSYFTLNEQPG